jgi:CDP-glucose 4,6-dehydratase
MTILFKEFYSGKRVLITGHTGFKGSWLSLWLNKLGADVVGYAFDPPTNPSLFEICDLDKKIISIDSDVRYLKTLVEVFKKYSPEIVFHLAAQSLVIPSYENPVETYETNVLGTVNILEACRQSSSARTIVNITSDKCYKNNQWLWGYRENDPLGGNDPYSSSKACAELVTASYLDSFFNPDDYNTHRVALASARAGNVIGGGDWAKYRLIPDCIAALQSNGQIIVRHPDAIRPWQHVIEPLYGYLLLAQHLYEDGPLFSGGWNFGPDDDSLKPVSWLIESIRKNWGNNISVKIDDGKFSCEEKYLKLDCSKAKFEINWHPQWKLETAVEKTVEWYQAYSNGKDMLSFTLNQIEQYEEHLLKPK